MTHPISLPRIFHGGDYNPEQWPETIWDDDVRLMQKAHVNIATLPVFGWVSLQPAEDTFTFEWLDTVIDKLWAGGVSICLATATASQPAWLDAKYPDVLTVGPDGQRRKHGNRHSFCPNSPNFRRLSTGLAGRLAERYGTHPALQIWHIGNEYGGTCYCDLCAAAFREWLKARYGSLAEVNRRWYTAFWGHTYTDWSQIETPTYNGEGSLQALKIDYDRFQSDSLLNCYQAEAAVLREVTPNVPITTNLMGSFKTLDYHKWAREMDIVSWDSYPGKDAPPADMAFQHSLMRGLKEGQPFLLMEQTPSQQNWQAHNALKRPGVMRLWSYQALAHGADSVMYFQWRRGRGATEKYHGAVVEHEGTDKPRVFQEVAALGRELEALGTRTLGGRCPGARRPFIRLGKLVGHRVFQRPQRGFEICPPVPGLFPRLTHSPYPDGHCLARRRSLPVRSGHRPDPVHGQAGHCRKARRLHPKRRHVCHDIFSGIVDETDLVTRGGYPGPLRRLLGVWAEEIDALTPQQSNSVVFESPFGQLHGAYPCRLLCDRIQAEGADVLATYGSDFYAGEPAVTVNAFGQGQAYYLATALDPDALHLFFAKLCADKAITPPLPDIPGGVEVMPRVSPSGETLLYVLNHTDAPASVPLPAGIFTSLLTEETFSGQREIAAHARLDSLPRLNSSKGYFSWQTTTNSASAPGTSAKARTPTALPQGHRSRLTGNWEN